MCVVNKFYLFIHFSFFKFNKQRTFASVFLLTIINIFIQVILINIFTYLDRTFKGEQKDIN